TGSSSRSSTSYTRSSSHGLEFLAAAAAVVSLSSTSLTLTMSAWSQMLKILVRASSRDGHNASLRFGSYERSAPASLATFMACRCVVRQGSAIKLIDP
uniref:Uncharacterized protein n=1 Tax=Triticum urartu TaxID=4572 RepID=A0A8R7QHS3_TRIUA